MLIIIRSVIIKNLPFGEYLKQIRIAKKLSQRDLAARIKVDFTYLSKIENNRLDPPSEATIKKIAEVLDENVDNLILLANKIPSDYMNILKSSERMPLMFRKMSSFTSEKQEKAFDAINKIESED